MSSINVINIKHPSASGNAITLAADGSAFINTGALGIRNRIINGDMRIDQRNAGASLTYQNGVTSYGVDRFCFEKTNLSTLVATLQQVSDGPAGFDKSIKVTVTTAQASAANSSFNGCDQRIEGFNWADMAFGTASAKTFTMSFWVKSSVTGTYPVSFFNNAVDRAYLATYSISSANTWEYKTITVPGDTSGTWNTTTGIGLGFQMSLGAGSNSEGTAGSWNSTYKGRTSSCVNLNATLNATWQITGVQIEAGTVATAFERRPYGQELALCQRYFEAGHVAAVSYNGSGSAVQRSPLFFKVNKRAAPSLVFAYVGGTTQTPTNNGIYETFAWLAWSVFTAAGQETINTYTASAEL